MVWVEVKKITYRRVLTAWLSLISEYNIKWLSRCDTLLIEMMNYEIGGVAFLQCRRDLTHKSSLLPFLQSITILSCLSKL